MVEQRSEWSCEVGEWHRVHICTLWGVGWKAHEVGEWAGKCVEKRNGWRREVDVREDLEYEQPVYRQYFHAQYTVTLKLFPLESYTYNITTN